MFRVNPKILIVCGVIFVGIATYSINRVPDSVDGLMFGLAIGFMVLGKRKLGPAWRWKL